MASVILIIVVVLSTGAVILTYNVIKENRDLAPGMDAVDDEKLLFRG